MSKSYVYPKGVSGLLLGEMIRYVDNVSIEYIDDISQDTSLETLKDSIIASNSTVNLANSEVIGSNQNTISILKGKLESFSIKYNENSYAEYALKVVYKLEKQISEFGWKNIVGIELCGLASDKHIGYIDDYLLLNSNANILYICSTPNSLSNINEKIENSIYKDRMYAICFPLEYTEELGFLSILCKTSLLNVKNNNVSTIYLGHGLMNWSLFDVDKYYKDRIDYITVGLSDFEPNKLEIIKQIKCGYLGFDLIAKEVDCNSKKDSIVFAPYNEDEFVKFLPLIESVITDYRIVYRDRRFFEGEYKWRKVNDIIEEMSANPNFVISDTWGIPSEVYNRCFAFVGGLTTSINTFPIISLSPSISDNENLNKNLGIVTSFDICEFRKIIDDAYLNMDIWKDRLLKYRNENVYNFGFSSEVLGNFIISNFLRS